MTVALIKQEKVREALLVLHDIVGKKLFCSIEDKMYIAQSLGSCYNTLKQYRLAEKYYLESVEWSKQSPLRFQFLAYQGIAQFYVTNTQYSRAEPYLKLLLNASREEILPNYLIDVHLMWFKVDSARQNYPEAIRHYQQYKALQDSIYNETKSRQINQLSIQYETEKHKNKITELNQKNQLAQNRLDRAQLVRNFTFGGIVLLSIIMGLLYRHYRHKQESTKVILDKNEQLQHLLTEKEWLVKEIHHRVKNNFHIVASLLEIQSSYLKNKEALSAIKESQHRIHSMSIIHQKLYQSETLSTIHMPEYIYELVEYLRESYAIRENVGFSLEIENIELNHASAITLGLILNEAITNAIKYAFANTEDGQISISLTHISDSQILLSIADNGRGLPTNFDSKIGASMGMELLQGLTDDLGGSLSIETNGGTHIKVIFRYKAIAATNVSFS
jgi:two-component sensor histidine kinase